MQKQLNATNSSLSYSSSLYCHVEIINIDHIEEYIHISDSHWSLSLRHHQLRRVRLNPTQFYDSAEGFSILNGLLNCSWLSPLVLLHQSERLQPCYIGINWFSWNQISKPQYFSKLRIIYNTHSQHIKVSGDSVNPKILNLGFQSIPPNWR